MSPTDLAEPIWLVDCDGHVTDQIHWFSRVTTIHAEDLGGSPGRHASWCTLEPQCGFDIFVYLFHMQGRYTKILCAGGIWQHRKTWSWTWWNFLDGHCRSDSEKFGCPTLQQPRFPALNENHCNLDFSPKEKSSQIDSNLCWGII